MTRTRFQHELDRLKQNLLAMAGMAEQAVQRAMEAYGSRDTKTCRLVFTGEASINLAEREIDDLALELLAMQQPMAVDLRFILAGIKINADLERVGDQAVNIAERVMRLIALPPAELPIDLPRIGFLASLMVRQAIEAFVRGDAALARAVLQMDDQVDAMNDEAYTNMSRVMRETPQYAEQALNLLLISRNLERVADHATNIAEDVIFWVQGANVRHGAQMSSSGS
jgi:phosphate transport system protein